MTTLLAIDVGNTHITLGLYDGAKLEHTWRLQTDRHATSDELGLKLSQLLRDHPAPTGSPLERGTPGREPTKISLPLGERRGCRSPLTGIIIASVVPSLDLPLTQACRSYLHLTPFVITNGMSLGIVNRYENPDEVGTDRLINAVAVHHYWKKPAIVVDFGTATTFDCVSARGEYLGGVICPGFELAGEWLATRTAKLPRVTLTEVPSRVLGKTTRESLQSGLFWGYIGLVEGLLARLSREMQGRPFVVATGGLSALLGPSLKPAPRIVPELTLDGLRIIWERHHKLPRRIK